MSTHNPQVSTPLIASEHEEQCWLLQQQNPARLNRQFRVWTLDAAVDASSLEQAIVRVIERMPDLDTRYHFSDEGDLQKFRIAETGQCLAVLEVKSSELMPRLRTLREIPWDAATQPPFTAWIIHTEADRLLAFIHHPILDQTCREEDILTTLHDCYHEIVSNEHTLGLNEVQINSHMACQATDRTHGMGVEQIADIILNEFRAALGDPEITVNDDFFDRGGHSLVATRIIGKLAKTHGIEISFNDFFQSPTAAVLAAGATVNMGDDAPNASPRTPDDAVLAPLTLAQTFLWRAYAGCGFSSIFNLPFVLNFLDRVDEDIFLEAFNDILVRHPGLRTAFHSQDGEVSQRIISHPEIGRYKWCWKASESVGVTLADEAAYVFDLSRELPIRIRFLPEAGDGNQILSFLVHHMAIDEWSLNTMMKELAHAYLARASGKAPAWENPAQSIADFALRQKAQGINQTHLDYWVHRLRDATRGLDLGNSAQSAMPSNDKPFEAQWIEWRPEQGAYEQLLAVAKDHHSSFFSVVYTAIALALHHLGNLKDLVIGTSASGRTNPEFFDAVGYFTTMVAHRVQFLPRQSVGDFIKEVTRTIGDSMAYADVPIDVIQNELGIPPEEGLLFDVYVQIHANNALNGVLAGSDSVNIRYRQILPDKRESLFGLHFEIMENVFDGKRDFRLVVTYQSARYSTALVNTICAEISRVFALFGDAGGVNRKLEACFTLIAAAPKPKESDA